MSVAVSDDPLVRLELFYGAFSDVLANAPAPMGARRGDCVLGVAAFVAPGHCVASRLPPETRVLSEPGADASDLDRFLHNGSVMAAHDMADDHCHVGPVGVEPGFQGMGIGRAVMGMLCHHFDEHGRLAWLETDTPENVRFYIGLGFDVAEEVPVLSAPLWFMRRDPR
jgi:ribosomal protein S18 acetylase RimI-like enzyme